MTLVLVGAIGGKCAITTADTRRTKGWYWEDAKTGEWGVDSGSYTPTDKVVNKVNKLTNFVTYASAGNSEISKYVIKKLKKSVLPSDGILVAGLRLREIIQEMRKKVRNNENVPFFYKFLDDHDKFGIALNGFTNEVLKGKSYFCFYISGASEDIFADEIKDGEYKYAIWAPHEEYALEKEKYMNIEFQSKDKSSEMASHFLKVHAIISQLEQDYVSEMCDFHSLEWKGTKLRPKRTQKQINTFKLYGNLALQSK